MSERFTGSPDISQHKREEVFRRLESSVEAIQDSESFRAWLTLQGRFHTYSWRNTSLILAQRPEATRVAGLRTWNSLGRFVNKGERGIDILAPIFPKGTKKEDEEAFGPSGFIGVKVFDVQQTSGKPLPEVEVPVLEGDQGGVLYNSLESYAGTLGVRTTVVEQLPNTTMGLYDPHTLRILIRSHLHDGAPISQLQRTKTHSHELAHHIGGHGKPRELAGEYVRRSRSEEEAIAEACAYVTLSHFGLDSGTRSFPYIATWAQNKQVLKNVMGEIQRVSGKIIAGAEAQLSPQTTDDSPKIFGYR